MMNRLSVALAVVGVMVLSDGCTLGEIYGEKCQDWVEIYSGDMPSADILEIAGVQDAKDNGHCPENYVCGLNDKKSRICRKPCDDGFQLCNDKCLSINEYTFRLYDDAGITYCESSLKYGCNENGCVCPSICVNGCDENGACICQEECVNGCDESGACKCPTYCVNGCDENGKCICSAECVNGCDENGKCICSAECVNGCDENGKCICKNECVNGCDEQLGECICEDGCSICDDKGECTGNDFSCSEECVNGCDEIGNCKCKDGCVNGCNDIGICICREDCVNGCDENGKCICSAECVNGCDESGKCKCSEYCVNGCDENGICSISSDDLNNNHMIDSYETAPKQGISCKTHSDCKTSNSEQGQIDGFCDSFIGYRCSTRCTNDSQCMPDETINGNSFHYVCRPDGRCAPDTFETVWKTTKDNESITILLKNATECKFDIDWGDGTTIKSITNCQENLNHKYSKSGNHHVKIKGKLDGWHTTLDTGKDDANAAKLIEVVSFGNVALGGDKIQGLNDHVYKYAFANAINLNKLSQVDIPNSQKLTSMFGLFENDKNFDYPIDNWDISNVENMGYMFKNAENFNKDIGKWDTQKVTRMPSVFENASAFNQDISNWDTSKVNSMWGMFKNASAFNQNIGGWNTSNVTNMSYMFNSAKSFNKSIGNWDTSHVTDMSYMFKNASIFNQDISGWNISLVKNMKAMFSGASEFNQNIGGWNTSNVENMSYMFNGAISFNQDIGNWSTSKVTDMSYMFNGATSFNQDISGWKVTVLESYFNIFCNSGLSEEQIKLIEMEWSLRNNSIIGLFNCE